MLSHCARESKVVRTGKFLREKLMSDHGSTFSYYQGQQGAANRQDS